jgi:hypothetical protein
MKTMKYAVIALAALALATTPNLALAHTTPITEGHAHSTSTHDHTPHVHNHSMAAHH